VAKHQGPTYDDLVAALSRSEFSPVYLFHGEEDFLIEEATDAIISAALREEERGFNLDVMYGSDADTRDVVSHASSFPMMAERRVVVVREADKLGQADVLASYIEHPSPSTCLVLSCPKPDFRRKPFVTAKKHAFVVECKPLWDNQVPAWITRRVKSAKREIHPDAASLLAAYVGSSLRELSNELEKLYIYLGEKKTIIADDVNAVVGISREFSVFELQWAIGMKDTRKATEMLDRLLDAGEQPVAMVAILTKFFQTIWKLLDLRRRNVPPAQQMSQAGVFYSQEKYSQVAHRFTMREIEEMFLALSVVDEKLKTSGGDAKLLLQTFIVNATQSRSHAPAGVLG
jgi:DNA polymerase-3 subunit delta